VRKERTYANGITIYWDTETGEMGIGATKRGHRYLEKRAKAEGKTVSQYCRDVLTNSLGKADAVSFRSSIKD
jgi:hypothetical protein